MPKLLLYPYGSLVVNAVSKNFLRCIEAGRATDPGAVYSTPESDAPSPFTRGGEADTATALNTTREISTSVQEDFGRF